jgi:hypothetical protein
MTTGAAKQKINKTAGNEEAAVKAPPATFADAPITPTENVDKIRDILFGASMRDYEKRFSRLEERLLKESSDIREDIRKRLGDLESYIRQEIESLSERITAEARTRTETTERVSNDISELSRTLEKRAQLIEDQYTKGQRDLRQQMLEQSRQIGADIARNTEVTAAQTEKGFAELRNEKTDRATLAGLFTEVAMRLRNEFSFPLSEDPSNGGVPR